MSLCMYVCVYVHVYHDDNWYHDNVIQASKNESTSLNIFYLAIQWRISLCQGRALQLLQSTAATSPVHSMLALHLT